MSVIWAVSFFTIISCLFSLEIVVLQGVEPMTMFYAKLCYALLDVPVNSCTICQISSTPINNSCKCYIFLLSVGSLCYVLNSDLIGSQKEF